MSNMHDSEHTGNLDTITGLAAVDEVILEDDIDRARELTWW